MFFYKKYQNIHLTSGTVKMILRVGQINFLEHMGAHILNSKLVKVSKTHT